MQCHMHCCAFCCCKSHKLNQCGDFNGTHPARQYHFWWYSWYHWLPAKEERSCTFQNMFKVCGSSMLWIDMLFFSNCRCTVAMVERTRADVKDVVSWWRPSCKGRKSYRDGSFFNKSHLTLQQWFLLIFWGVDEESVTKAGRHSGTSIVTAINVYHTRYAQLD